MPEGRSPDAGYSGTPLPVKLGIGEGDEIAIIGAPEQFEDTLGELPDVASLHTTLADDARYDVIIAFMTQRAELEDQLAQAAGADGTGVRAVDCLAEARLEGADRHHR